MSEEQIETQSQPEVNEQVTDQAVETVSPDNSETVNNSEGNGDSGNDRQHRNISTERRIGKLVGKIGHLGRENESLKAQLEEANNKINALTPADIKPDIADPKWKTIDEYNDALINWHQRQQNKNQTNQPVQSQSSEYNQRNNVNDDHVQKWANKFSEYAKDDPEINSLSKDDVAWFMQDLPQIGNIIDRSYNPALVKHFAKNPDLVFDLEGLDSYDLAREIGKIEASLPRPVKQPKITNAMPPITPVKGDGARPNKSLKDMSPEDYYRSRYPNK